MNEQQKKQLIDWLGLNTYIAGPNQWVLLSNTSEMVGPERVLEEYNKQTEQSTL